MFNRSNKLLNRSYLHNCARNVHVESKIASLGLKLPNPAVPKGNFTNYVQIGNMVYLSGHLPQVPLISVQYFLFIVLTIFLFS